MPVSGSVTEANQALKDNPSQINSKPFDEGNEKCHMTSFVTFLNNYFVCIKNRMASQNRDKEQI